MNLQERQRTALHLKKDVLPHEFECQNISMIESPPRRCDLKSQEQAFVHKDVLKPSVKQGISAQDLDALDKFKRRLIRSVARLLVKENKPEDEVFEQMKKETGCNCRLLWDRMRALTTKKLHRLLSADDCSENIPVVGRMTLTDWLLFDMVIVHEDIDVIGKEEMLKTKKDCNPLLELFVLVQRFNIESRNAESLAEAWTAATIMYNSKGHQCSPMLMQRRWYQLKKWTRELFYNYWFAYRGSSQLLPEANKNQPTKLQRAIAQRFPSIILQPFMSWEEMIKKDLVIMPEVFEDKMRQKTLPQPLDENSADVVIVDREVETINVDDESDSEQHADCETNVKLTASEEIQNTLKPVIKVEVSEETPEEYSLTSEEHILEKEREVIASIENAELALDSEFPGNTVSNSVDSKPNENTENANTNTEDVSEHSAVDNKQYEESENNIMSTSSEKNHTTLPQITNVIGNVDMSQISHLPSSSNIENKFLDNINIETIDLDDDTKEDDTNIDTEIKDTLDSFMAKKVPENLRNVEKFTNTKIKKPVLNIECKKVIERALKDLKASFEPNIEANDFIYRKTNEDVQSIKPDLELEIAEKADLFIKSRKEKIDDDVIITDLEFADDGIEFIDDGIELDDHEISDINESSFSAPVVKSEDTNVSENSDDEVEGDTGKFDLKLLMDPVVYTLKLDDMEVLKDKSIESLKSDDLIKEIDVASKILSPKASIIKIKEDNVVENDKEIYDDIFRHGFDDNELEEPIIGEDKKVKVTSSLLNKPRVRDYNFITLCKNPDFNTRLKRLNVGFFSSWRNRELLKECKPVTIDVSKAFEQKLFNGILYLKETKTTLQDTLPDNNNCEPTDVNIKTSSITSQSLLDGLVTNMLSNDNIYKEPNQSIERNTVINLPNINDVRRINQQLLTAEVTPIQMRNLTDEALNTDGKIASELPEPSKETQNQVTSHDFIKSKSTEIIETNKNILDKQTDAIPDKDKTQVQPKVRQKRQPKHPVVSWLSRRNETYPVYNENNDVLLTMDSLNKMIQVMNGIIPLPAKCKKPKSVKRSKSQQTHTKTSTPDSCNKTGEKKCINNDSDQSINDNSIKPRKTRAKRTKKKPFKSVLLIPPLVDKEHSNEQPEDVTYLSDNDVASNEVCDSSPAPSIKINIHTDLPSKIMTLSSTASSHDTIQSNLSSNDMIHSPVYPIKRKIYIDLPSKAMTCSPTASSRNTIESTNSSSDGVQSSISETVNHLLIEAASASALSQARNDASTTTSDQEIQTAVQAVLPQPIQTVNPNPIFSVLPTPKAKNTRRSRASTHKNSSSTKLNVNNEKICSCQLPIMKLNQKHIILDGSNYCASHGSDLCTDKNQPIINQKVLKKIISESSLRLAKDKILLSTVTFSGNNVLQIEGGNDSNLNKVESTPLPPGVQLVLPPNGELTYYVEPGVELKDTQIEQLHSVIKAVKLKMSTKMPSISAQPICISNEVVDLTFDEVQNSETQKTSSTNGNPIEENVINIETENTFTITKSDTSNKTTIENVVSINNEQNNELLSLINENNGSTIANNANITYRIDDSNIEVEEPIETSPVNVEYSQKEQNSSTGTSILPLEFNTNYARSQNLSNSQLNEVPNCTDNTLEDINNSNLSNAPKENMSIMNRKSILSDLMEISGIGEEDIAPAPAPEVLPLLFPVEYSKPVITLNTDNVSIAPITSFKELKYAYENKASFFELNCVTGIIQKVNVCLTKTTKSISVNNEIKPALPLISSPPPLKPLSKIIPKPLVTNKNIGTHKPIIIRKIEKFKPLNFKTMNKMKTSLLKPNLTNVRRVLMRSKVKLYERQKPPITLDITSDNSDSSDDEPLIKKARRMKEIRENTANSSQSEKVNKTNNTNDQECSNRMEVEVLEHEQSPANNVSSHNIENNNLNKEVDPNVETSAMSTPDETQQGIDHEAEGNVEDLAPVENNVQDSVSVEKNVEVLQPIEENVEDLMASQGMVEDSSDEECILGV